MVQELNLVQLHGLKHLKVLISFLLILFTSSFVSSQTLIYNGYNTSEASLGILNLDMNYSGHFTKGTITDGQHISRNGTFLGITGQIGYLRAPVFPSGPVVVTCPPGKVAVGSYCLTPLNLYMYGNQTYFDIGDSVLLWVNITKNSTFDSLWLFSSDNTSYPFSFVISSQQWMIYYKIKQKQEYLMVISYTPAGEPTGIGEFMLTYNPNKVTSSWYDSFILMFVQYGALMGVGGILILFLFIFIMFVLKPRVHIRPAPSGVKQPTSSYAYKNQIGVVGGGLMGSFNNVRNYGNIIFQVLFGLASLFVIFVFLSIVYYILKLFHFI